MKGRGANGCERGERAWQRETRVTGGRDERQSRLKRSLMTRAAMRTWRGIRALRIRAALADPVRHPPILCASIGRVASTMLYRSIVEGRARAILGSFNPADAAHIGTTSWTLRNARLRSGTVSKTHDLPYALDPTAPLKIVYSFGRPSDTVLSVLRKVQVAGETWRDRHLANMHALGSLEEVVERDVLRLGEQIEAWRAVTGAPLLAIHYEALWDVRPMLEDFLGFTISLPEKRTRGFADLDPVTVARVRRFYAGLDEMVAGLPPYWLVRG